MKKKPPKQLDHLSSAIEFFVRHGFTYDDDHKEYSQISAQQTSTRFIVVRQYISITDMKKITSGQLKTGRIPYVKATIRDFLKDNVDTPSCLN